MLAPTKARKPLLGIIPFDQSGSIPISTSFFGIAVTPDTDHTFFQWIVNSP